MQAGSPGKHSCRGGGGATAPRKRPESPMSVTALGGARTTLAVHYLHSCPCRPGT